MLWYDCSCQFLQQSRFHLMLVSKREHAQQWRFYVFSQGDGHSFVTRLVHIDPEQANGILQQNGKMQVPLPTKPLFLNIVLFTFICALIFYWDSICSPVEGENNPSAHTEDNSKEKTGVLLFPTIQFWFPLVNEPFALHETSHNKFIFFRWRPDSCCHCGQWALGTTWTLLFSFLLVCPPHVFFFFCIVSCGCSSHALLQTSHCDALNQEHQRLHRSDPPSFGVSSQLQTTPFVFTYFKLKRTILCTTADCCHDNRDSTATS